MASQSGKINSDVVNDHYNDVDHDDGLEAHSHRDIFPPWWVLVRDDDGGTF